MLNWFNEPSEEEKKIVKADKIILLNREPTTKKNWY